MPNRGRFNPTKCMLYKKRPQKRLQFPHALMYELGTKCVGLITHRLVMGIKVLFVIPVDGGELQSFQFQAAIFTAAEITSV